MLKKLRRGFWFGCVAAALAQPLGSCTFSGTFSALFGPDIASAQPTVQSANRVPNTLQNVSLAQFQGKTIRNVTFRVRPIFDDPKAGFLYSAANNVKIQTRERVLRRELFFQEGDTFDEFRVRDSERNLRLQRFLRNIQIRPTLTPDNKVDIEVVVQDIWSVVPQVTYSSGTGRKSRAIGLADTNFLGFGQRLEGVFEQDESRSSIEALFDDPRFLDSYNRFSTFYFTRNDGEGYGASFGRPFRSTVEKSSWNVSARESDTIGRLFANSDERYIYGQDIANLEARYTIAASSRSHGRNPDDVVKDLRFSVGYAYDDFDFRQANAQDYQDLDLDPTVVSNDPSMQPLDRRFSGPVFAIQRLEPNYLPRNYIDRFDRTEDYNIGDESLLRFHIAPKALGSRVDSLLVSGNRSKGWKLDEASFLRAEAGFGTRLDYSELRDSLLRGEIKYYNVLGDAFVGERFFGKHTLAVSYYLDYGNDLDNDRELLLGGDNGLRGYKARTFTGDKRMLLNIEERAHLVDDVLKLFSFGTVAFVDVGGTGGDDDTVVHMLSDDMFADVGFGLRFGFPRFSNGGIVRADVAFPVRDGPEGSDADAWAPRFILSAGQAFGSRLRSEVVGVENATTGVGFDR